ncbi:MAG: cytochrome C oxidase subunit II [Polyangiaceae bacterium]|nr:cytochrome C oxidase subunit II [Polyangiaceae bacterium]
MKISPRKWLGARRALLPALAGFAVALTTAGLSLAKPQPGTGISLPVDASADGHRIDWLIGVTNAITAVLFVAMTAWIFIAAIKHGEKHTAKYDHGTSKRSMFIALGMAGSVFVVVDGNLFVNSTMDLETVYHNFKEAEKDPNSVLIEVNGHQWAWDFRYAGPDGKFNTKDDIVRLNDMRIPVDTPIVIEVASTDVIHSFNLPNMRTKVDAVPGQINKIWFKAKMTGEFDIGCAQHCGTNHYKMKALLTVLSKEEYAKWAKETSAISERAYDEKDESAHWGWDWKDI